ncbi:MAG: hypothetical protein JWQ66_279 [Mucilaginibacter sp.]|nr:hypothetical protein [Mucilaginibacter sp.]
MNTRRVRMAIAIGIVLIYISINYKVIYTYIIKGSDCSLEVKAKDSNFNGLVIKKFLDTPNHGYKTILVENNGNDSKIYFTDNEDSLLWKRIEINYFIRKERNSLNYYLKNGIRTDTIKITYNCKN